MSNITESAPHKIAIAVCTLKRPGMLERCLASLAIQSKPEGIDVAIIVVDNDAEPASRQAAERAAISTTLPIHYVHQPRRGIAVARNAVLSQARRIGADWVLMVDDDQWLDMESLIRAWGDAMLYRADVVSLRFVARFPNPRPFWCVPDYFRSKHEAGQNLRQCGTGGVLFRLRDDMAFDEMLGLNGGEDTAFFYSQHLAGAKIVASDSANVFEEIVLSRLSYRWQVYRDYCNAASNLKMHRERRGARAIPARAWKAANRLISGVMEVPILPFYALWRLDLFKYRALKVGKKIAWASGIAAGLAGRVPTPYRTVTGY